MPKKNQPIDSDNNSIRFELLFEKLEEAKQEQGTELVSSIIQSNDANETIALFKEYQDNMIQASQSTYTMA